MRSPLDLRLGRLAILLLATVSGVATAVILLGGGHRSSAQVAALAALRERPVTAAARTVTTVAAAPSPEGAGGGGGGGGASAGAGGSGGGGGGGGAGSAGSGPAPSVPVTPTPTPTTPAAPVTSSTPTTSPTTSTTQTTTGPAKDLPKVGHVFELSVSARSYASAFGHASTLPYLKALARRGTLLSGYDSLGHGELADELALIGGQAPNPDTAQGCTKYADFPSSVVADKQGIVPGTGCIYPETALTIGDQVTASGKQWHAYVADMGKQTCVHPNSEAVDDTELPFSTPQYDTRHNPFIYFHSLLDLGDCSSDDVDLSQLPAALRSAHATPTFTYVAADACADVDPTVLPATSGTTTTTTTTTTTPTTSTSTTTTAGTTTSGPAVSPNVKAPPPITVTGTTPTTSSTPTTTSTTTSTTTTGTSTTGTTGTTTTPPPAPAGCPAADPSGPTAENAFLKTWIPKILASAAYRADGVLIIAVTDPPHGSGHPTRTGALVLSRWAARGHTVATAADPYALLRLTEDLFGDTPLAHAAHAPALAQTLFATTHH